MHVVQAQSGAVWAFVQSLTHSIPFLPHVVVCVWLWQR